MHIRLTLMEVLALIVLELFASVLGLFVLSLVGVVLGLVAVCLGGLYLIKGVGGLIVLGVAGCMYPYFGVCHLAAQNPWASAISGLSTDCRIDQPYDQTLVIYNVACNNSILCDDMAAINVNTRVQRHIDAMRMAGLRPVQIWVSDTRRPDFAEECRRQSQFVAQSDLADTGMQHVMNEASQKATLTRRYLKDVVRMRKNMPKITSLWRSEKTAKLKKLNPQRNAELSMPKSLLT